MSEPKGGSVFGIVNGVELGDVASTMLLMLYGRAMESRSKDPILRDPVGERWVEAINDSLAASDRKIYRRLAQHKMSRALQVHAAIRAKQYDAYAREFMEAHPGCAVVNLGCGLDARFWRIDDGKVRFFDLDLPEVIRLKGTLAEEAERYTMLPCSVLDPRWLDDVLEPGRPVLLMAEGLFMYLPRDAVRALIATIGERVHEGQLVIEVVKVSYTRGINRRLVAMKFKRELGFDKGMTYEFGLQTGKELEGVSPHIRHIDDWSYFDSGEKKLGLARLVGKIDAFKWVQWTARYAIVHDGPARP